MTNPLYPNKGLWTKRANKNVGRTVRKQEEHSFLSREEFAFLLKTIKEGDEPWSEEAFDLTWFMGNFGLRVSETVDLRFEDFSNLAQWGLLRLRPRKRRGEMPERQIRFSPQEVKALSALLERRKKHRQAADSRILPMSIRKAQYIFTYYCKKSGLLGVKPRLSIHALRHTCGVILYEDTQDLQFVRGRLGHKSLKTVERYIHLSSRRQSELGSKRAIIS